MTNKFIRQNSSDFAFEYFMVLDMSTNGHGKKWRCKYICEMPSMSVKIKTIVRFLFVVNLKTKKERES